MQQRIKNITQHIIVKRLFSLLLIGTFLLSITPKQVLHNLFANHEDHPTNRTNNQLQFNAGGYNCDVNSTVATAPFIEVDSINSIGILRVFEQFTLGQSFYILSTTIYYYSLRGPPVVV